MRICVFSERMRRPFDEGIKNYALHLARGLADQHEVMTLTAHGESIPELGIENLPSNPLLFSPWIAQRLRRFRPEVVLYVPTACATPFSFWRTRMLKLFAGGAPTVMVALQLRQYGRLGKLVMPRLCPDLVFVQSEATQEALAWCGCPIQMLSPGIDTNRFHPATPEKRLALRHRYGIRPEAYVACHVGHLNRGRNVQALLALQRHPGCQVVVVGSTSTTQDGELVAELRNSGALLIDTYVPDVAEIYQMADCYTFPVHSHISSIDMPLSVLEAMACNLPVVTTRFGGLPTLFQEGPGFAYIDSPEQLAAAVEASKGVQPDTRRMVEPYAWPRVAQRMLEQIAHLCRLDPYGTGTQPSANINKGLPS
ncbi:MAG: glycosyltransferase family 4 protein [Chloroflexi bacterium]|jgi:glycosyltransferase involved in cell wall biosynthesis|nr:glycosyltransferase family 4 protein [Chloroflexota bacterium]